MKVEQWTLGLAAEGVISFGTVADIAAGDDLPDELRPLAHRIQSELPRAKLKIDAPADRGKGVVSRSHFARTDPCHWLAEAVWFCSRGHFTSESIRGWVARNLPYGGGASPVSHI